MLPGALKSPAGAGLSCLRRVRLASGQVVAETRREVLPVEEVDADAYRQGIAIKCLARCDKARTAVDKAGAGVDSAVVVPCLTWIPVFDPVESIGTLVSSVFARSRSMSCACYQHRLFCRLGFLPDWLRGVLMEKQNRAWLWLLQAPSTFVVGRSSARHVCPVCGSRDLSRIRRRPVDRLFSLFLRVYRYRCGEFRCCWEGNLRRR